MTGNDPKWTLTPALGSEATRGGFMKHAVIGKHHEAGAPLSGSSSLYLIVVFSAAVAVLILGISFRLNRAECLVFAFTAAALVFGVVFTFVEMRRMADDRR
jgi:hypothetical protein